jgi:ATP-dependent RNA helicase DeaD
MTESVEQPPAPEAPAPRTFADMNLDPAVKQALDEMGYEVPMEVQDVIYKDVVEGKDLMVQSRTGSGKTAAFGIPIAQVLSAGTLGVQALVLAPTRELALQVAQELGKICTYKNLQVVPVYGGAPMGRQIEALRAGAQIVVGTPGRILDHMRRGTLKTGGVKMFVLDECDEMLSMGFQEDIEKIISECPPKTERQTLLFSATIPEEIERIARRHMREPEKVILSADFVGVHEIDHRYYLVSGLGRTRDLLRILEFERPESALIFCNTRDDTALVAQFLSRNGYDAEAISSDLSQPDRERVMGRMRARELKWLVATDIAARGIDISDLPCVVNYTFPEAPEIYIHRTGRTGRAGKSGIAISLVGPREIGSFYYLKLLYKIRPEERELPTEAELKTRREGERYERLAREVGEDPGDDWLSLARRVWQSAEGERLIGAILKRYLEGPPQPVVPRPAPEPQRERETMELRPSRPRDERPRERERERGDRGRRDRDRPRRDDRDRRERPRREAAPAAEGAPATGDAAAGGKPAREFWETWVDEKSQPGADGSAGETLREREPRRERDRDRDRDRDRPPRVPEEPGFVRVYVNVGKREGLTPEDMSRLVAEAAPEDTAAVGKVLVMGTHTYLSVKDEAADKIIGALTGKKVGEREIVAERAKR